MERMIALAQACRRFTFPLFISTFLLFSSSIDGCSTNPATGERQINLVGEQQEIAMGKQASQQVDSTMGLFADPGLQEYIASIGKRLASVSERPNLPWKYQ